jgi:hypothetical protein
MGQPPVFAIVHIPYGFDTHISYLMTSQKDIVDAVMQYVNGKLKGGVEFTSPVPMKNPLSVYFTYPNGNVVIGTLIIEALLAQGFVYGSDCPGMGQYNVPCHVFTLWRQY